MKRIFLLSHMRAYTSLIGHILGSNPQISGYYEMHINYNSPDDLTLQESTFALKDTIKPNSKYLFDKLLHNNYQLNIQKFNYLENTLLVSLRSPEQTIKSIVHLFKYKKGLRSYAKVEKATEYYIERLTYIANFCIKNKLNYYYYDAELIPSHSVKLLKCLSSWLELETPLSTTYEIFSQTGKPGAGDSSKNISQGKIGNTLNNYESILISEELLIKANKNYLDTRNTIVNNSIDYLQL